MIQCDNCQTSFVPYTSRNRFCSYTCKEAHNQQERREALKLYRQSRDDDAQSADANTEANAA
jgi:hypothetical protein